MPSKTKSKRLYWGKNYKNLPELDLLKIQKESYKWFVEKGIAEILEEVSPIQDFTGKNWELSFGDYHFLKPRLTPAKAIDKGLTYDAALRVETVLTNLKTGKKVKREVFLGDIPQMTERATFVVNGVERCVINQIVRSPGAFFFGEIDRVSGRMLQKAEIRPLRGSWIEFFITRNNVINLRIDRRRKFSATILLRALGLTSDEEIIDAFKQVIGDGRDYILATLAKDSTKTREEALIEIYSKLRPGEPALLDNASALIENMFFNNRRYSLGDVGRYKVNTRLGLDIPNKKENQVISKEDIIALLKYLINLQNGVDGYSEDDIDNLSNRRLRCVGEIIASTSFRIGVMRLERSIKEKMSLVSTEDRATPSQFVNARPIIAPINEFFRSSQLSSILDQVNPLSEIDNLRRVSVLGPGGISRDRASFSIRDINSSQYGRICPVRSPEGQNIGLVTYLALYTRVNDYGFLESPYCRVIKEKVGGKNKMKVTNEVVYFPADEEMKHYITHRGIRIDEKEFILDDWVSVRHNGEFSEMSVERVDFIDVVPRQLVGISASLIPFLANDMAGRSLMGSNMQCQAVPLVRPTSPVVGTGMEEIIPEQMKWVVRARNDGKVIFVDGTKIIVKIDSSKTAEIDTERIKVKGREETYLLEKFRRTSPNSTCFSQKPLVSVGDVVKKGDLLIDGPSCQDGELALGQNMLIAYSFLDGLGYEDAIVVSDRSVRDDLLTSIKIEEHDCTVVETKLGPEELTRDIPNVGDAELAKLDEDGIIAIGSEVGQNDILVGKIAPKGETELTAEERLLRAIFGEKAREVRDTSLKLPHGEAGTVIDIKILDRDKGDELEPGAIKKVIVKVAQMRKVNVGDKLAGRHGNKGVISKIVPQADMPYLEDGTPVDIIISPLSVLTRMNLGQLLEAHLGWAAEKQGFKVSLPVFEKVDEKRITDELTKAGLPIDGKVQLYDGKTGEPLSKKSVVGISYVLKLSHMVEDKSHARSTGPYSLVTQQPLGGKAQMGGQRLGEMEVWALESHRAAYTLQEMLTIKSDDVVGRAKAFEAIVKGTKIPEATIPESFKVLIKELNSLCLDIETTGLVAKDQEPEETQEEEEKTKKEDAKKLEKEITEEKEEKVKTKKKKE
ncbi:MAG: DNA-directed RNA polymerase subunit beta [Patescibacteria group bacterium]